MSKISKSRNVVQKKTKNIAETTYRKRGSTHIFLANCIKLLASSPCSSFVSKKWFKTNLKKLRSKNCPFDEILIIFYSRNIEEFQGSFFVPILED